MSVSNDSNGEILNDPAMFIARQRLYDASECTLDLEQLAVRLDDDIDSGVIQQDEPTPTVDELLEAA